VFIEAYAVRRSRQYALKRGLAHRKWVAPQIIAIKFDEIECSHENGLVVSSVSDTG
jgi:hypothetical protein